MEWVNRSLTAHIVPDDLALWVSGRTPPQQALTGNAAMLAEALSVVKVAGETMIKLVPISIAFGIVFGLLTHWSACNPGRPWWRKREIVTDICYWFLIPLAARFVRIGFMVMGAAYFYGIHGADALISFYDDGFGPLARMPLWAQALTFLLVSDFLTYCGNTMPSIIHRKNSTGSRPPGFIRSIFSSARSLWTRAYCSLAFRRMSCCGSVRSQRLLLRSCTQI